MTEWHDIIRRCRSGDEKAQMEAYRRTWKFVFPAVYRVLRNREEAEDIMQEAYIKGFMKLKELREPDRYPHWQKQIAVRQALNRLRQLRPTWHLEPEMEATPEEAEPVWDDIDPDAVAREVERLPEGYRIVVELHVMEQLSHEEVGEALGIKASSARSQYTRAIQKLRQQLNAHAHS
ncbi:MAG: RNA polymerase sigma factor [Flavobacteriales bacterium]